jgi:hypothetical protein
VLELSKGCKKLKRVELRCTQLDEACMIELVRSNPGLLSLNTFAVGLTDKFMYELAVSCRSLTRLELVDVKKPIAQNAIHHLLERTPLSYLHLDSCMVSFPKDGFLLPVTSATMRTLSLHEIDFDEEQVNALLHACPQLLRLELANCRDYFELDSLLVGTNCPLLQELAITDESPFDGDDLLLDISAHCPQLRVLHISTCGACTITVLPAVVRRSLLLETVKIINCKNLGDNVLLALAESCRSLRTLRLFAESNVITDAGV